MITQVLLYCCNASIMV